MKLRELLTESMIEYTVTIEWPKEVKGPKSLKLKATDEKKLKAQLESRFTQIYMKANYKGAFPKYSY